MWREISVMKGSEVIRSVAKTQCKVKSADREIPVFILRRTLYPAELSSTDFVSAPIPLVKKLYAEAMA
jgi:hypothetical protein